MLKVIWFICCIKLFYIAGAVNNTTTSNTVDKIGTLAVLKTDSEGFQPPVFKDATIERAHKPTEVRIGGIMNFRCGVRGKPKPEVRFYKESQLLSNSHNIEVAGSLLRVTDIQPDGGGKYRCEARNIFDSKTLPFLVVVNDGSILESNEEKFDEAPHWANPKKMKKILHAEPAGSTVQFRCQAEGSKPLTTEWFKNGVKIKKDERVGGYKFRHKFQIIELKAAVVSDDGEYHCVVSNQYGSINHTYELDITERSAAKPILQEGLLKNQTVSIGADATFRCKVFSDTVPHVQWLKINTTNSTDYIVVKKAGVNTTNAEMQTLTLRNVSQQDEGEYVCLAGNSIGISYKSAWLIVDTATDPITVVAAPINSETPYLYILIGIAVILVAAIICYVLRKQYGSKEIPRLVPIENPENIPQMTKMEEPLLLMGGEHIWDKMCHVDHIEINIQPDLQWELKREDILLRERIDEGFFGQIYIADLIKCVNGRKEKVDAAVKMLKAARTEKDAMDLLTEMDQMKRVGRHKNIINLLGVCTQNGLLWLVTEYAQQGNLRDYLRRNRPADMYYPCDDPSAPNVPAPRSEPLSQKDLMSAAYQVVRGMEYLAEKKCIHRDLAARNVLVTDDYVMKIADFGLARDIRSNDYYRKHTRGHLPYKWMALEAMMDNVFTHATDVWSFGVLLWEIFSLGGSPYPGVKTHELVRFLRQGERLEHPQFASLELYRLMRDCWEENPQKRPKFRQLVEDLDRMLAESSSADYIDLSSIEAGYMSSDSESGIDEKIDSSRESSIDDDEDSVFEHSAAARLPGGNVQGLLPEGETAPLLSQQRPDNVLCNGHARIESDV